MLRHRSVTESTQSLNSLEITGLGSISVARTSLVNVYIMAPRKEVQEGDSLRERGFPVNEMAGHAAGRMSIPGFYYDEGKNRYFKLRPGEKPPKLLQTEDKVSRKDASATTGGDVASGTCSLHRCIVQREYHGVVSRDRRLR